MFKTLSAVVVAGVLVACLGGQRVSASASAQAAFPRHGLVQLPGTLGCIGNYGRTDCMPARGLDAAAEVHVSPDGRNVYVVSTRAPGRYDAVAAFSRNARSGTLRQLPGPQACVSDPLNAQGCTALFDKPVRQFMLNGLTLSPDGRHAYLTLIDDLYVLRRDSRTGALKPVRGRQGCLSERRKTLCIHTRRGFGVDRITFSPNGRFAYLPTLADGIGDARPGVAAYRRNQRTGALHPLKGKSGCLAAPPRHRRFSCRRLRPMFGGTGQLQVMSEDGRHLYVALGATLQQIAVSPRTGSLSPRNDTSGCFQFQSKEPLLPSCRSLGERGEFMDLAGDSTGYGLIALAGPNALEEGPTSVMAFERTQRTGRLSPPEDASQCLRDRRSKSCGYVPALAFYGPKLTLSATGRFLYITGRDVFAFDRRPRSGAIRRFSGSYACLLDTSASCGVAHHIRSYSSSATSADGRHLYVASPRAHALTVFERRDG